MNPVFLSVSPTCFNQNLLYIILFYFIFSLGNLLFSASTKFSDADQPVQWELPTQWLWDIVDEFIYQFQSFSLNRAKTGKITEADLSLLRESPSTWNVHIVLNVLYKLIEKSNINEQLEAGNKGEDANEVAGDFGCRNMYKMLGYFSIVGLLRLHTLLGKRVCPSLSPFLLFSIVFASPASFKAILSECLWSALKIRLPETTSACIAAMVAAGVTFLWSCLCCERCETTVFFANAKSCLIHRRLLFGTASHGAYATRAVGAAQQSPGMPGYHCLLHGVLLPHEPPLPGRSADVCQHSLLYCPDPILSVAIIRLRQRPEATGPNVQLAGHCHDHLPAAHR